MDHPTTAPDRTTPSAPTRPPAPPRDGTHVIVGATGALGSAVVRRLVADGRRVLAVARSADALDRLADEHGRELVAGCVADLGTDDCLPELTAAVQSSGAPVALALYTAGLPVTGSVDVMAPADLALAAGLKAASTARLLRAVHEGLVPGSRFVAVAGSLGLEPGPRDAAPGTANAALVNLMRQIAALYGPRQVVVHTLAPGPLDTPRLRTFAQVRAQERGTDPASVLAEYVARTDLGYLPTPDDVAWLVTTLLAPEAAALHAAVLTPDAGARHAAF